MRIRLPLGRSLFFTCALLLALAALLPMRLGLAWLDLDEHGLAAREARGSVWNGALTEAQFGAASLGDIGAGLNFFPLVIGRARIGLERTGDGEEDVLDGAVTVSGRNFSLDDMRASLQAGDAFAPLPMRLLALDNVSVQFEDGLCVAAEGMVRAELGGEVGGIPLPATLAGNARCEDGGLLLPLTSQSGMEQVNLRLGAGAEYTLELVVNPGDETLRTLLEGSGFTPGASGYAMTIQGVL